MHLVHSLHLSPAQKETAQNAAVEARASEAARKAREEGERDGVKPRCCCIM